MGHDSNVYSLPATDGYELMRGLEKILRYIYNAFFNAAYMYFRVSKQNW